MAWVSQPLKQTAKCPSCNWEWRELVMAAGIGAFAVQRQCPRRSCRAQVLLVYCIERVEVPPPALRGSYLGSVLLKGQNEFDLRRTLSALRMRQPRLTADDVDFLVHVAVQLSQPVPAMRVV